MSPRIVGFIVCYNEIDIIEETLQFYQRAQVPLVFIDNGSNDGTAEAAAKYRPRAILEFVRKETGEYDLRGMLDLALSVAARHNPEWIMHIDADHLYEPGEGFDSFYNHARDAERLGCNVINFDEYVFFSTPQDDPACENVYDRIKHYAFRPGASAKESGTTLIQPRLYRFVPGMSVSQNGGHTIHYPQGNAVVHPVHGILRHYMFRSAEQGRKKLRERRARYSREGRARGWHGQYDRWSEEDSAFCREAAGLALRKEGTPWRRDVTLQGDGAVLRTTGTSRENP